MNILIIGCGKVGSRLAGTLCTLGHGVSIIAQRRESFDLLPDDFSGFTIQGVPIDLDTLRQAGIEGCSAIATVTEDDNTNIMVCQIAREIFNVKKIIARTFDPLREDIFSRFGIQSICPTNLTAASIYSMLTDREQTKQMSIGSEVLALSTVDVPQELVGKPFAEAVAMLRPESPIAVIDKTGRITMAADLLVDTEDIYLIKPDDRLLLSANIK